VVLRSLLWIWDLRAGTGKRDPKSHPLSHLAQLLLSTPLWSITHVKGLPLVSLPPLLWLPGSIFPKPWSVLPFLPHRLSVTEETEPKPLSPQPQHSIPTRCWLRRDGALHQGGEAQDMEGTRTGLFIRQSLGGSVRHMVQEDPVSGLSIQSAQCSWPSEWL
jgi:hypothetical protein